MKPDAKVPVWDIIKKVVTQDITKVSLPVAINEPMSGCQRIVEAIASSYELLEQAADCDDPIKRLAYIASALIAPMSSMKYRMKKPFNPMLSETYELVTDRFRCLAEKVEHQPRQIVALALEGKNYKMWRHNWATPQFRLYGGRGMYEITETGCNDIFFSKYNQHYTTGLPIIKAKNLIFGQLFIDLSGSFEIVNHQSPEKAIVYIHEKVSDA